MWLDFNLNNHLELNSEPCGTGKHNNAKAIIFMTFHLTFILSFRHGFLKENSASIAAYANNEYWNPFFPHPAVPQHTQFPLHTHKTDRAASFFVMRDQLLHIKPIITTAITSSSEHTIMKAVLQKCVGRFLCFSKWAHGLCFYTFVWLWHKTRVSFLFIFIFYISQWC